MKLMCNIDMTGRILRAATGLVLLINGILMLVWNLPGDEIWSRVLQVGLILMGAFVLFEGVVGWCAIRAMGYRTRF